MTNNKKKIIALVIAIFSFIACEAVGVLELKEGVKYPLKSWPDSVYLKNLESHSDTINKVEKAKWVAQTSVKMTTGDYEVVNMSRDEYYKRFGRYPPKSSNTPEKVESVSNNSSQSLKSSLSSEKFLEKFSNKMESIRKDPNNSSLYRIYTVSNENDISNVLLKTYGSNANQIPSVLVKYQLKSFNSKIDFENLKAGDKIKLPKI